MKPIYEIVTDFYGVDSIKRTDVDGSIWWIPTDPTNSDYQRYLNPEAEQSTPIVIDEAKTK
jgi:hypothetical protein